MNLYLVARYGNDEEGPDGKDTLYLVAASSCLDAAKIVDKVLVGLPHKKVYPKSNWVCLLGSTPLKARYKGVLKGPFYDLSGISGASCLTVWIKESWHKKWQKINIKPMR